MTRRGTPGRLIPRATRGACRHCAHLHPERRNHDQSPYRRDRRRHHGQWHRPGFRSSRFRARYHGIDEDGVEDRSAAYQRLRRELLDAERRAVVELRNEGTITEAVMQRVQRDIDLEDSRLDV